MGQTEEIKTEENKVVTKRVLRDGFTLDDMDDESVFDGIEVEFKYITPPEAKMMLKRGEEHGFRNRLLRKNSIRVFARDMASGRWNLNGETIVTNSKGVPLNGYHRLTAVVISGVAVPFIVVTGVNEESFASMDQGGKRTVSDVLHIRGDKSPAILAAAIRLKWWYDGNRLRSSDPQYSKLSHAEAIDLLGRYPKMPDSISIIQNGSVVAPLSVLCFAHHEFSVVVGAREIADDFMDGLIKGAGLRSDSPILALRNRLARARADRLTRLKQEEYVYLIFRAWNAHRMGQSLSKVIFSRKSGSPIPEPV